MSLAQSRHFYSSAFTAMSKIKTVDQVLSYNKVGPDRYVWPADGVLIEADTQTMRAALEDAYDPNMPDWTSMVQMDTCGSNND